MRLRNLYLPALLGALAAAAPVCGQATGSSVPGDVPLRAEARLVRVDVSVVDAQGAPITGLHSSDFEVRDNGAEQKVGGLEEHHAAGATAGPITVKATVGADGVLHASNGSAGTQAVWNVVLVDLVNSSSEDLARAARQLGAFLAQLPPADPVALMAMSKDIQVLVPFEAGAAKAASFVASHGLRGLSSAPSASLREHPEDNADQPLVGRNDTNMQNMQASTAQSYARSDVELKGDRVQLSFAAFAALAMRLRQYPGRKNVFWLSAGFPLQADATGALSSVSRGGKTLEALQKSTLAELEQSRIAIFPVDIRGLEVGDAAEDMALGSMSLTGEAAQRAEMLQIAAQTGGVAKLSNDITGVLRSDFSSGQEYYTLFYTPQAPAADGPYHTLALTVAVKGAKLFYRPGYFARSASAAALADGSVGKAQFRDALQHKGPTGSGLRFSVAVRRDGGSAEVSSSIDRQALEYAPAANGKLASDLDCAVLEYSKRGDVLETSLIEVNSPLPSPDSDQSAVVAKQSLALRPGAASLTVGVRDRQSGAYGTLDVDLGAIAASGPALAERTPAKLDAPENRIEINAIVRTRQGAPVADLQAKDFSVFDGKAPQGVDGFEAAGSASSVTSPPVEVILLLDAVNTTFGEYSYARDQAIKFLTGGGRLAYPTVLAVLSQQGLHMRLKPSDDGNLLADQLRATDVTARSTVAVGDSHEVQDFQLSLQTMENLAENESKVVGRKMLIWIGPGWPTLGGAGYSSSVRDKQRNFEAIMDLTAKLQQARMVVYNISLKRAARAYQSAGAQSVRTMVAAEDPGALAGNTGVQSTGSASEAEYHSFLKGVKSFHDAEPGSLALQVLAVQSGGRVLDPSNDMAGQIAQCEKDAGGFYSMSFVPGRSKKANEYHDLKVKVDRPDTAVQNTSGFYGQP